MPLLWNRSDPETGWRVGNGADSRPLSCCAGTEANAVKLPWWMVLEAAKAVEVVVATIAIRMAEKVNLLVIAISPRLLLLTVEVRLPL
jgi:hypothetical protein